MNMPVSVAVGAAILLASQMGCGSDRSFGKKKESYEQVLSAIQSGQIDSTSVANDVTQLPPEFRNVTEGGAIYLARSETTNLIVVFPTWRGKGKNVEGHLYSSAGLPNSMLNTNYYGQPAIRVNGLDLTLDERIEANWYKVSYRLD
jgi:hypothetical protein